MRATALVLPHRQAKQLVAVTVVVAVPVTVLVRVPVLVLIPVLVTVPVAPPRVVVMSGSGMFLVEFAMQIPQCSVIRSWLRQSCVFGL